MKANMNSTRSLYLTLIRVFRNGADRSGLFCGALYIVEQIKARQEVDIFPAVKHIRLYRPQCIVNVVSTLDPS